MSFSFHICCGIEGEEIKWKIYQRFEFSGKILSKETVLQFLYRKQKVTFEWEKVVLRVNTLTKSNVLFSYCGEHSVNAHNIGQIQGLT